MKSDDEDVIIKESEFRVCAHVETNETSTTWTRTLCTCTYMYTDMYKHTHIHIHPGHWQNASMDPWTCQNNITIEFEVPMQVHTVTHYTSTSR